MGVSGSGKSTVGQALAERLNCPFFDGDDYHPAANVAKMAEGVPLNDEDRAPWLAALAALIKGQLELGETAVVACSALKRSYRDQLRVSDKVLFIHLQGDFDLIWKRIRARDDHYMKEEMLQSQFDALESPDESEAITVPIDQDVEATLAEILHRFQVLTVLPGFGTVIPPVAGANGIWFPFFLLMITLAKLIRFWALALVLFGSTRALRNWLQS